MALIPKPLARGSLLAAISPAGPVGPDEVARGAAVLAQEGFNVRRLEAALHQGQYLAGTDLERARDLMRAFRDDEFDGIVCTRGGYGSMRLLHHLDFDTIAAHPKPFIGFSDITALQTALWQRCSLVTFSGPQLARGFGGNLDDFSSDFWFSMLRGELWGHPLPTPNGTPLEGVRSGRAEGPLLGGNLAVLAALCGTDFQPDFSGAIVLLEEIDEPPYRLDRMMTQLAMAGVFDGARGVLLGRFTQHVQGELREWDHLAAELIAAVVPDVPVALGAPYGHTGSCWTLPLGAGAELDTETGTLIVKDM